ncbi:hypothetical protein LSTR_LSTR010955 [Laodelphax striatellus]|uniref:Uncharacterized protein n=1 Tax=Laodelphax striatellus TaxID=195883 RepID=A0A482XSX1_LAOST|nr:hypothetical protein LSTR_LSTR010955 [Laodelphax striatellus]
MPLWVRLSKSPFFAGILAVGHKSTRNQIRKPIKNWQVLDRNQGTDRPLLKKTGTDHRSLVPRCEKHRQTRQDMLSAGMRQAEMLPGRFSCLQRCQFRCCDG